MTYVLDYDTILIMKHYGTSRELDIRAGGVLTVFSKIVGELRFLDQWSGGWRGNLATTGVLGSVVGVIALCG